jgi:hypothetical protein
MAPKGVSSGGEVSAMGFASASDTLIGGFSALIGTRESPLKALVDSNANSTQADSVFTALPFQLPKLTAAFLVDFR